MKSKKDKIDSKPLHSQICEYAVKVKGHAYLIEYQDLDLIYEENQRGINNMVSMILEDLAEEIRRAGTAVERFKTKRK